MDDKLETSLEKLAQNGPLEKLSSKNWVGSA